MKKRVLCIIFLLCAIFSYSQEINVISQNTEKTTVTFQTEGGIPVPIYNILSEFSGPLTDDIILHTKELELIGNAPLTLELQNGHYTFQMYKEGDYKFDIIATGADQVWNMSAKGDFGELGIGLIIGGAAIAIASSYLYLETNSSKEQYDTVIEQYEYELWLASGTGDWPHPGQRPVYEGFEYWQAHSILGIGLGVVLTGIITSVLNMPKATQVL